MKFRIFDMEVFPDWWCLVYRDYETDEHYIITSDESYEPLIKRLNVGNFLVGFNIKGYDLRILNAIAHNADPQQVYEVSQSIIDKADHVFNDFSYWNKYNFTDLEDDWLLGSLKEFESNSGMDIQETSVPFDKENLTDEEKQDIIKYCIHDVDATYKLFSHRDSYINSKITIAELFNFPVVSVLKHNNAKICAMVLKAEGKRLVQTEEFVIPDKVKDYVTSNLPQDILDLFKIFSERNKPATLFDNDVVFGIGGIHSVCSKNIKAFKTDTKSLINIDVTSYYPNLMMGFNYMSRNVPDPSIFRQIYDMRVEFKKQSKQARKALGEDSPEYIILTKKQEALKLILNTTYGAMKSEFNPLYDPQQASSVCYLGQMLLAALANKLYNNLDLTVVQTNTDGILVYIKNTDIDKMKEYVHEWETMTGFTMEFDDIDKFFQRDVNNYIEVGLDGSLKVKGKWTNQYNYNPYNKKQKLSNLNAPITHLAILKYYTENIPIEDTINAETDIYNFCFTTKTSGKYDKTYYYYKKEPNLANKTNRVVACTNEDCGTIMKYKKPKNGTKERYDKAAEIPEHSYLLNDVPEMIDNLDRQWYIDFAKNKLEDLRELQ